MSSPRSQSISIPLGIWRSRGNRESSSLTRVISSRDGIDMPERIIISLLLPRPSPARGHSIIFPTSVFLRYRPPSRLHSHRQNKASATEWGRGAYHIPPTSLSSSPCQLAMEDEESRHARWDGRTCVIYTISLNQSEEQDTAGKKNYPASQVLRMNASQAYGYFGWARIPFLLQSREQRTARQASGRTNRIWPIAIAFDGLKSWNAKRSLGSGNSFAREGYVGHWRVWTQETSRWGSGVS
jgi:hypothetical protein